LKNSNKLSFENNFDLLRLYAAIEVVLYHIFTHFIPPDNIEAYNFFFQNIVHIAPGVPIFFMISGFLIFWSFERNSDDLKKFFTNRAKRIFPGLWVCTIVTLVTLILVGGVEPTFAFVPKIMLWILGQISFFQFWTPDVFKSFGLGNPNGVLATITVEIQFYLSIPILFLILKSRKKVEKNTVLLFFALISYIFNQFSTYYFNQESVIFKLISVSVFPYFFYFIFGILFYLNFSSISKFIESKFHIWLIIFLSYHIIFSYGLKFYVPSYWPNIWGLLYMILLSFLLFSFAFSFKNLSDRLLIGNDFSYGIYIYHGFFLNLFVGLNFNTQNNIFLFSLLTSLCAFISWKLVEKRFVVSKKLNIYKLKTNSTI
jgi:peptidoglycan/LPS O-acetylase OafA/YrhL